MCNYLLVNRASDVVLCLFSVLICSVDVFTDLTLHVHHTSFLILLIGSLVIISGISIKPV